MPCSLECLMDMEVRSFYSYWLNLEKIFCSTYDSVYARHSQLLVNILRQSFIVQYLEYILFSKGCRTCFSLSIL